MKLKQIKKDILQVLNTEVNEKIESLIKKFKKQVQQIAALEINLATFFFSGLSVKVQNQYKLLAILFDANIQFSLYEDYLARYNRNKTDSKYLALCRIQLLMLKSVDERMQE